MLEELSVGKQRYQAPVRRNNRNSRSCLQYGLAMPSMERFVVLIAIAVFGVGVVLPTQMASAVAQMNFPVTVNATVPANGSTKVGSPTLPASAKSVQVDVDGFDAEADNLIAILPELSNKQRLLTCAGIGAVQANHDLDNESDPNVLPATFGTLRASALMGMCFQMVEYLAATAGASASTISPTVRSTCPVTLIGLQVAVKKTAAGYSVTPTGTVTLPARGPLSVRCLAAKDGVGLAVSARGKNTLRRVVGSSIGVGIMNTATSGPGVPVSVKFGIPR